MNRDLKLPSDQFNNINYDELIRIKDHPNNRSFGQFKEKIIELNESGYIYI